MKRHQIPYKRIVTIILSSIVVITILSLTIGQEIYGDKSGGLWWFAIVHFLGYLFFLVMPVEMAFVYYLPKQDESYIILIIALSTAILAQLVDYFIGYTFSTRIINNFIGRHRYEKAEGQIKKYGNIIIFLFNLLPLSSPIIALAAGMLKHRLKALLLYSILGLLIKYMVLVIIFY